MEATRESKGLFDEIQPPRTEDAGLEDCALPPESIQEAFLKAASAVRSAASIFSSSKVENEGGCTNNPWPRVGESADTLVGIVPETEVPGGCVAEKSGVVVGDAVAVADVEKKVDELVGPIVPEEETWNACVDGFQGLDIGSKDGYDDVNGGGKHEEEGEACDRPILAEGHVL